jgi:hypothetical protein
MSEERPDRLFGDLLDEAQPRYIPVLSDEPPERRHFSEG